MKYNMSNLKEKLGDVKEELNEFYHHKVGGVKSLIYAGVFGAGLLFGSGKTAAQETEIKPPMNFSVYRTNFENKNSDTFEFDTKGQKVPITGRFSNTPNLDNKVTGFAKLPINTGTHIDVLGGASVGMDETNFKRGKINFGNLYTGVGVGVASSTSFSVLGEQTIAKVVASYDIKFDGDGAKSNDVDFKASLTRGAYEAGIRAHFNTEPNVRDVISVYLSRELNKNGGTRFSLGFQRNDFDGDGKYENSFEAGLQVELSNKFSLGTILNR